MGDLSKEYFDSFLTFSKLMIVYVNFLFISEILSGILITFGIVIYQNLSRLIVVVSSILFLFLFFDFFNEYTLVYSLITGLFFLIIIQLIDLNKNKIIFFFRLPKIKINFLKKISGLIFVALISQLYLLYERMIFSGLSSGLISAYQYSKSLHDIPYFLIVMTIQTSLWPAFLEAVNLGNTDQIYQMTVKKLKLLFIIFY